MAEGSSIPAIVGQSPATEADEGVSLSAAHYRLLTAQISDVIVMADMSGRLIYVSPACRAWGYEPRELIGRPGDHLVHPDDLERFNANTAQVFAGPVTDTSMDRAIRYRRKDGDWVWLEGNPQLIHDAAGRPIELFNVLRDVTARKAAEEAAAKAEAERRANAALFENAFQHASVGKALVGLDGRFVKINPALCQLLGYSEAAMLGMDRRSITHSEDLDADLGLLAQLTAGEIPSYELDKRYIRADGEIVWVGLSVSMVTDDDGAPRHYIAQVQDQTAHRAAEKALAESEAQYRLLADASSDIIVRYGPDGIIRYVSPACRSMGVEPEQQLGLSVKNMISADMLDEADAHLAKLFDRNEADPPAKHLNKLIKADGAVAWLEDSPNRVRDASGNVIEIVSVLRDVTDRLAAEAALEQSERRFRHLAENAPDMISEARLDGVLTYVSPASTAITGFTPEELVGQSFYSVMPPEDGAKVLAMCRAVFDSKGAIAPWPVEFRAKHKDGRDLWLECKPTLAVDPKTGRFTGLTDVIRDITERKAMEAALLRARADAEAAAAVKGEFLANMSHEIRTPLTAILGFAGLLAERDRLDDVGRGYLNRVQSASRSLLSIVNDILDFSKLEAGCVDLAPRPIALPGALHETFLMFAPQAEAKGLTLDFIAESELPSHVEVDTDRLRQIVFNLVGNAIKFTQEGSIKLRLSYAPDRQLMQVAIEDSGPGISQADCARLFQRFAQVDGSSTRRHGGTGLGLAICRGLVEAMGGKIGVDSRLGRGSTFWFTLKAPVVDAPAAAGGRLAEAPSLDGVRVLVVDDNPVNRELACAVLQSAGAETTVACGGEEAIEFAAWTPFDVILLDRRMPGMDGCQTLRRLRGEPGPNETVPILAFTADTDIGTLVGPDGFDDYVGKPVDAAALIETIARWSPSAAPLLEEEADLAPAV